MLYSASNITSKAECRTITIACIHNSEYFILNEGNFSTEKEMLF